MNQMQVNMTVGLHEDLAHRLSKLAQARGVTRNRLLTEGVELILAKYSVEKSSPVVGKT